MAACVQWREEDLRYAPREDRAECGDPGVCAEANVKVCLKGKREARRYELVWIRIPFLVTGWYPLQGKSEFRGVPPPTIKKI